MRPLLSAVLVLAVVAHCSGQLRGPYLRGVPLSFFEGVGPFVDTFVTIKNGTLKGKTGNTISQQTMYVYQNIPYAKPPIGQLRFAAPEPHDGWGDEIRDATRFPPSCPQHSPAIQASSEDCLYLNVYSTKQSNDTAEKVPVMLFVHGGGFNGGESTYYSGGKLLIHGGVVVVMHYRLGPLGYLSTNDEVAPGNHGLKDVAQALRWIQENIDAFGGDKDQVTIFGESAGGAAAIFTLISPLTRGLFHRVIAQSGTAINEWALDRKPFEGAQKLAGLVGCKNDTSVNIVSCLRELPWEDIVEAAYINQDEAYKNLDLGLEFQTPTIEPDLPGAFITKEPIELLQNGSIPDVPVVLGTTLHEGSYVLGLLYQAKIGPDNLTDDADWMRNDLIPNLLGTFGVDDSLGAGAISESVALAFMPGSTRENFTEIMPNLVDMMSVFFMKASVLRTADILSRRLSNVYLYSMEEFSKNSMWSWLYLGEDAPPITPGITHADDLMYIFNMPVFPSATDTAYSKIMSEMWSNIAKYGNPTPNATETYPLWPRYTVEDQQFMKLNVTSRVSTGYPSTWRPRGFVPA